MDSLTAFLLGAICGGLGYTAAGWIGWSVGMLGAIAVIIVEYVLSEQSEVEE